MTREIEQADLEKLPTKVIGTYLMYANGIDPKNHMSMKTYYLHRRELLRYGVDIKNMTVVRMPMQPEKFEPSVYDDNQQELKLG